ncbi:MAG: hypothetical protein WAM56_21190 [Acidobacteriaceae bacterium]
MAMDAPVVTHILSLQEQKGRELLRGFGPEKPFLILVSVLLIPFLTFAQSSGHSAVPGSILSSSLLPSVELPDAPMPVLAQNTQSQQQKPQNNEPSLGDLGFTPAQTQANAKLQARLNKRTHMLKIHQTLGLITRERRVHSCC